MSDNIPFEIQVEIMKRLPVKSLIRSRSVSKAWKSVVDSADFIKHYSSQRTNLHHLFLNCDHYSEDLCVSVADDHSFPHQQVPLTLPPWLLDYSYDMVGCSHGLLCLSYWQKGTKIALLWNFAIRKAVALVVPNGADGVIYSTVIGFGVCPVTTEPKIVNIAPMRGESTMEGIYWQAKVFTLTTGAWRSPYSTNLPCKSLGFDYHHVVIDRFLYWLADDRIIKNDRFAYNNLIISFDITSEEFRQVNLPDSLYQVDGVTVSLSKLKESLVVLEHANDLGYNVWRMEDGFSNLFTKLFTINVSPQYANVMGFRKSGEPIISFSNDGHYKVVYEPYSKHNDNVVIDGIGCSYYLFPYMETLLLLNQPTSHSNSVISEPCGKVAPRWRQSTATKQYLTVHKEMITLKFEGDLLLEPNFNLRYNGISFAFNRMSFS